MESLGRCIAALGLTALCGCPSSDDTTEYPFRDELGRSCVRTCVEGRCGDDCDATPEPTGGCEEGEPCWAVTDELPNDDGPPLLGLCASCCVRRGIVMESTWQWQDCSPVVCEVTGDCAVGSHHCSGGYCLPNE